MIRLTLVAMSCAAAAFAQNAADVFNKPPEAVDRALRARINEFYEDHVKGQFRDAEALVAEDTKEFFYDHDKPRYLSFSIQRIDYSDDFTKAKATMLCEQYVMFPGFANKPVKIPSPSTWKLENGKWYWYVDPESLRQSPFGRMTAGTRPASGPVPSPSAIPSGYGFVMKQVKADPESVDLARGESAEVTITNAASGPMTVSVTGRPVGVEAQLAHTEISGKDKTTLTLKAGDQAKSGTLSIAVMQTREVIPIRVTIH